MDDGILRTNGLTMAAKDATLRGLNPGRFLPQLNDTARADLDTETAAIASMRIYGHDLSVHGFLGSAD
jgi:hypothetical protein